MTFLYQKNFAFVLILYIEAFFGILPLSPYQVLIAVCLCTLWGVFQYSNISKQNIWWIKIPYYLLLCLILNFVFCWINRGQTIVQSFSNMETLGYFFFLLFAYFFRSNMSLHDCENLIKRLFVFFIIVYLLKFFVFFDSTFINPAYLDPWEHRIRLNGQMIGFISYFYYLNRILIGRGKKYENIIFFILSYIFIFTLGFRTTLFSVILSSIVMAFRLKIDMRKFLFIFIGFSLLFVIVANTDYGNNVISNMTERMIQDKSRGENTYRALELNYFLKSHFISISDYIFGSGNPVLSSAYGKHMDNLSEYSSSGEVLFTTAQWRDWGIIGFSWIFGLPAALVIYIYIFVMLLIKTKKRYAFIASTYLFFLLNSVTTMEMYRHGSFAFHAFMLYMLYKAKTKSKYSILKITKRPLKVFYNR